MDFCKEAVLWSPITAGHVEWLENETGFDLTPCHDSDGTWAPTEACGGFPLDLQSGSTDWSQGCARAEVSGPGSLCGEPNPDATGTTGGGTDGTGGGSSTGSDSDGTAGTTGESTDGGSGTSGAGSTTGDSGGTEGGTAGGTDSGGEAEGTDKEGCSCRSAAVGLSGVWRGLLAPLMVRRRRRRS